jgi:glutaminase
MRPAFQIPRGKSEVSILSISKVFTMAKVMEESGPDAIASVNAKDLATMAGTLANAGMTR